MADDDDKGTGETPPENRASAADAIASLGVADRLKRAFSDYVESHDIQTGEGRDLNVDLDFVRTHGGPLVTHMLRSITQSLMPKDLSFTVPAGKPADAGEDAKAESGEEAPKPVNIHFDLGDFLRKLMTPPPPHDDER